MKQRVMSLKSLKEKEFKTLPFEGYWKDAIGCPENNFKALFWGAQKSGKSTLCLRLCDYLAGFGKVAYNSWEEGISQTFRDRVISNNVKNEDKIFLLEKYTFEEMMDEAFKRRYYKVLVIDSIQYMGMTYDQYKRLVDKYPSKIFLFISQANGRGKIKGGTDVSHAVDVMFHCIHGNDRVESRFAEEKTIKIFDKKIVAGDQLPLL